MKKFLLAAICFVLFASLPTAPVKAQLVKSFSHSIAGADTTVFTAVPGKIKAFTYQLTKTSGTVAGKVYLEGGIISGQWIAIDSLTLADVTTPQQKVTSITATNYLNYRYRCTNTSAAVATVKAAYLRRTDE